MGSVASPVVETKSITYTADGLDLVGHLATPDGSGPRPAVLVCHEGPGLDMHAKEVAERLATEEGYVAFALDYPGGGTRVAPDDMMPRLGALMTDPERTRTRGRAGLDVLLAQPRTDRTRVAAIGYCFGGTMALELARGGTDLRAVVGFHSGLGTARPEDARNIRASVLVCIGTDDPFVPAEQRAAFEREMHEGHVADWRMELYGGIAHSFTNPEATEAVGLPGVRYDARTDARSWRSMLDLFAEVL